MKVNAKASEKEIMNYLYDNDNISTVEMCKKFGVSVVTMRKYLNDLESSGLIVCSRGRSSAVFNQAIIAQQKSNVEEKIRIARAAADMIEDGDRVMIVAGTTNALIPKFLLGKKNIHIVTNSILLLNSCRKNPSVSITLVGGEFMNAAEALTGTLTLKDLELFHVKTAFIGTDGFTETGGVTANHIELAEICKKIMSRSQQSVLLADSSKYGKRGFAFIADLNSLSTIITDTNLSDADKNKLTRFGLNVIRV
ncbi:MAG: DeoR/GlpR family DNA-binding transcription regulator [Prevotellaceae bacterium]|jgi:DeoR family galactitol utilization operon repressor|nr:DeoR/GlpR family DNA-binding transcription regulator [Prevotellaceae bacterium]